MRISEDRFISVTTFVVWFKIDLAIYAHFIVAKEGSLPVFQILRCGKLLLVRDIG